MLVHYTQIDYDREIAIIALLNEDGIEKMVGVVRLIADPYNETAEYAIVVGDPWAGKGFGTMLTSYILDIARERGIKKVIAYVLEDNEIMLNLSEKFNFSRWREEDMFRIELVLDPSAVHV